MNFEIKVECKGSAVGTLGWLNEKLSKTEIVIKKTSSGVMGMFGKETNPEGKETYNFITKVAGHSLNGCEGYFHERISKTDLLSTNLYENQYEFGYFNIMLTPAAEKIAKEFLQTACIKFVEWWESDK